MDLRICDSAWRWSSRSVTGRDRGPSSSKSLFVIIVNLTMMIMIIMLIIIFMMRKVMTSSMIISYVIAALENGSLLLWRSPCRVGSDRTVCWLLALKVLFEDLWPMITNPIPSIPSDIYRVFFLTGPPDFQYQNETRPSVMEVSP